jgi:hypothetical protein
MASAMNVRDERDAGAPFPLKQVSLWRNRVTRRQPQFAISAKLRQGGGENAAK